ncbi:MAG: PrsW family intramembrane metalloprotease [Ignavibacteriaceae bacterium]
MLIIISTLAAVIPMILYLVLIWRFDIYEREPFRLVFQSYLWGAVGAILLAMLFSIFLNTGLSLFIPSKRLLNRIDAFYVAPFVEEITKGLFLLILVNSKKFDNVTDGLVYGGAIGLGFGMTENFLYFISFGKTFPELFNLIIIRTFFSAVMHCVSTGTLGAFLGYAKFNKTVHKITLPLIGLMIAMFIHFAWNYSVSYQSTAGLGLLFMFFSILVFVGVYWLSILKEKRIIYSELLSETETGLIPFEHLVILDSLKRNKPGWVDESIRKSYIKAATTLAFRKIQLKNSGSYRKTFYEKDVEFYREHIKDLLSKTILHQS